MRRLLVLVSLLFTLSGAVGAADAPQWYFAVKPAAGQLITYTVEGQQKVLIESGMYASSSAIWRLTSDSVLASFFVNDQGGLYRLTSADVQRFTAKSSDAEQLLDANHSWTLVSKAGPYVVLWSQQKVPLADALVVNVDAGTFEKLTDRVVGTRSQAPKLSADGRYVRYLSRDTSPDSKQTRLIERKLETGAERVLYTIDDDMLPYISVDQYGEHWLYQRLMKDGVQSTLITPDGKIEQSKQAVNEPGSQLQLVTSDGILSYSPMCKQNCPLKLQPYSGESATTLTLPANEKGYGVSSLIRLDNDSWLVYSGPSNWVLRRDGSAQALHFSPEKLFQPVEQRLSPDRRFILALKEDETGWQVWDNQQQKFALESKPDDKPIYAMIFYGGGGFVVEDGLHFTLYRPGDGQVMDLPKAKGQYFEPLADGRVLYFGPPVDAPEPLGIYLYNPADQQFTLLVEGGRPLRVQ
jgi:hypothetical protein